VWWLWSAHAAPEGTRVWPTGSDGLDTSYPNRGTNLRGPAKLNSRATQSGHSKAAAALGFLVLNLPDRRQQIGHALDLVDERLVQTPDESNPNKLCGVECRLIVECDVGPPAFHRRLVHVHSEAQKIGAVAYDNWKSRK